MLFIYLFEFNLNKPISINCPSSISMQLIRQLLRESSDECGAVSHTRNKTA